MIQLELWDEMTDMIELDRRGLVPADFVERNPQRRYRLSIPVTLACRLHLDEMLSYVEVHNVDLTTVEVLVQARWCDLAPALDDLPEIECTEVKP